MLPVTEHVLEVVAKNRLIQPRKADSLNVWNSEKRQWTTNFCLLKGTILYFFTDEQLNKLLFAFVLDGCQVRGAPATAVTSDANVSLPPGADRYETYIIDLQHGQLSLRLAIGNPTKGQSWRVLLAECATSRIGKGTDSQGKKLGNNASLSNRVIQLANDLEDSQETMDRLQIAAEASTKAASELVEQKVTEISTCKRRIETLLAESEHLREDLRKWKDKYTKLHHNYTTLIGEKAEVCEKVREMLLDWEEQQDEPKRGAVKMANIRRHNQELVLQNRSLRTEVQGNVESFHKRQNDFKVKVQLLKELMEATDVFDLLRKRLELAEHKIKYLEDGYRMETKEERSLYAKIRQLQQETLLAEAIARSYYLKHRGHVLHDQLRMIDGGLSHSEYYTFAKVLIERHGWLFREMEMVHRERQVPWWDDILQKESAIPFRSQLYPAGGIEGSEPWTTSFRRTIMHPPQKRFPSSQENN